MAERWLSVEEIAAHMGVNCGTIYNLSGKEFLSTKWDARKVLARKAGSWVIAGKAPDKAAQL